MRSLLTTAVLATVALTVSLPTARAQTSISLGASTKSLVFSTTKYSRSLDLNLGTLCPGSTNFCRASGMGDSGYFVIVGSSSLKLSEAAKGWSVSESGPLTFEFCSSVDCRSGRGRHARGNTVFLTGSLKLVDLELLPGSKNGAFDYVLVATLDGLKGPLANEFNSRDGQLDLNIQLNEDLSALIGHPSAFNRFGGWWGGEDPHHRLCAPISGGSLSVDPTPEPSSILLFGSGLLALGGVLRRRKSRTPRDVRIQSRPSR
jgi:hypothetical protein